MIDTLFTSEAVCEGHPDKIADQISDAILDACLRDDPQAKVAVETMVMGNHVILGGEITTSGHPDYEAISRQTIREIGYDREELGFDHNSCDVQVLISKQSEEIAMGVDPEKGLFHEQGAGDQGMMFGFASNETDVLMPLPITIAQHLVHELVRWRKEKRLPYLRPDGKVQVTIAYDDHHQPKRLDTLVISVQHDPGIERKQLVEDIEQLARDFIGPRLMDGSTRFYINPTGSFVQGGPVADCGITGRKTIVDTYGSAARHGGGAFSGKDPTKVDRSGAYAARYIARTLVAAGVVKRCEVQLAYAIGVPYPISIALETFDTALVPHDELCAIIPKVFDLSPKGMIEMLNLQRPIYRQVSFGGHFGRADLSLPWEANDRVDHLLSELSLTRAEPPSEFVYRVTR